MGFLSKAWKGFKGAVSKVAKGVKRVAKKVVTALPGGKKVWEVGSKIVKGIGKVVGKVTSALGPVGMIAASFFLPGLGSVLSSMWSGFGAMGTTLSSLGASMGGIMGSVASGAGSLVTGVFNAGNFMGGTLGAFGDAFSQSISHLTKGQWGQAGNAFLSNMQSAFSGDAGMNAVAEAANKLTLGNIAASDPTKLVGAEGLQNNPEFMKMANNSGIDANTYAKKIAEEQFKAANPELAKMVNHGIEQASQNPEFGSRVTGHSVDQLSSQIVQDNAMTNVAAETAGYSGLRKAGEFVSDFVGSFGDEGSQQEGGGITPYVPSLTSAGVQANPYGGSQGSAGFSLLSAVNGLEDSVRKSTALLTKGFV